MKKGLHGLPEPLRREREQKGKRVLDPGSGMIADWVNRYSFSVFPFTIGIVAERILPANPMRTYLIVQNKGGVAMFVNFGQNPTTFASIRIDAGGNYIFEGGAAGGAFCPSDDIYILGAAAGLAGSIGQGLWESVSV